MAWWPFSFILAHICVGFRSLNSSSCWLLYWLRTVYGHIPLLDILSWRFVASLFGQYQPVGGKGWVCRGLLLLFSHCLSVTFWSWYGVSNKHCLLTILVPIDSTILSFINWCNFGPSRSFGRISTFVSWGCMFASQQGHTQYCLKLVLAVLLLGAHY